MKPSWQSWKGNEKAEQGLGNEEILTVRKLRIPELSWLNRETHIYK